MQTPPELPPMRPAAPPSQPQAVQQTSGAPASRAAPMGPKRLRQMVTMIAGGGFVLVAGLGGLEMVAKPGLRPSDFMSAVEGNTERGIWNIKMGFKPGDHVLTEAEYRELLAEGERKGQAKAELQFQKKLAIVQADKERVVAAYQALYDRMKIIVQAALQLEQLAQQFRQQLIQLTSGGRGLVIMTKDIFCGFGSPEACESARADRRIMIDEADELSRGDVGARIKEMMVGVDDPATLITREDQQRYGTPALDRQ